MIHILQIVIGAVLSLVGGGFLCWIFFRVVKDSDDPSGEIFKIIFSVALVAGETFFVRLLTAAIHPGGPAGNFLPAMALVLSLASSGIILAIMWAANISDFLISPVTELFDGGKVPPEPKPFYSIAITKRKLNRPLEAIVEVRKQLANFPHDFEGVTLLANIQAEDLKDMESAEMTFNHFCEWPDAPPRQVMAAFTQLADWYLKLFQDTDSARAALEKIIARFPDTDFSLQAAQRIAHLGGTRKILLAAQNRRPVFVPEGVKSMGLMESAEFLIPKETDPAKLAAEFVKHLEEHPHDTEAREKLAIIYARHYQRLDLAEMELTQLADEPNQPAKQIARWLNLLADLQIHGGSDFQAVRATLQKIADMFPGLPAATLAQTRLNLLKLEFKGKTETPGKKLGVYEQNIGLKGNRSY